MSRHHNKFRLHFINMLRRSKGDTSSSEYSSTHGRTTTTVSDTSDTSDSEDNSPQPSTSYQNKSREHVDSSSGNGDYSLQSSTSYYNESKEHVDTSSDSKDNSPQSSTSYQNKSREHVDSRSTSTSSDIEEYISMRERIKSRRIDRVLKRNQTIPNHMANDQMCPACGERPKNGGFVHTRTLYISRCYECAKLFWNRMKKKCPCGFSSSKVVKICS
ncbi:hypothetical protein LissoIVSPER_00044 [Lissonota sp. PSUC_FEM 10030012]|nr:hypothetical protein [Lissonota sp. PSUC_FEM 10030012]